MTVSAVSSGNLRVPAEFFLDLARGRSPGLSNFHRFGRNDNVGGTLEDIWAAGGIYPWPTTAETIRIAAGGDPADDAAGAGAQSVVVEYLDENWAFQTETLVTAGAGASLPTAGTARRVIRTYIGNVGTYTGRNTGAITIENTASAQVLSMISAESGQGLVSMYTVPAGFTAYLTRLDFFVSAGNTGDADCQMWQRQNADDVTTPFQGARLVFEADATGGELISQFSSYVRFPERTDLWCAATISGATGEVSSTYDLILVDNSVFQNG